MLKTLLVIFFSVTAVAFSQKQFNKALDSITTIERAERFISTQKNSKNKIITFNEEKHKTRLSHELINMSQGSSKVIENEFDKIYYKIINKSKVPYYRVHYILLDGTQMSISDIDDLRPQLIAMIQNGIPFKDLALQYSMHSNRTRGGDSGWLTKGDMLPEFETQVMDANHAVDDVFMVNVESNKWYYVVWQSYPKKQIIEVQVLKVVQPKD